MPPDRCRLRLALRHFGVECDVAVLPDRQDGDLLARVELTGTNATGDPQLEELFTAIPSRHTCRRAFEDAPIDEHIVRQLRLAASAEGAVLVDVPSTGRHGVTSLITEADFVQMSNTDFRTHWSRSPDR